MNGNEKLIHTFYTAFKNKDVKTMQDCYADDAVFSDPAFKNLNAEEVRNMWAMLIKSGKDMRIEFSHIHADEHTGTAEWVAWYTFSVSGKKVVNRIKASFIFESGKIIQHQDEFNFYTWVRQALGLPGWLLGWTHFMKKKIRKKAAHNLRLYMANRQTL